MPCKGSAVQAAGLRKALEDAKRHMSVKTRDLQHLVSWQPPSALAVCRHCSLQGLHLGPPPEATVVGSGRCWPWDLSARTRRRCSRRATALLRQSSPRASLQQEHLSDPKP